MLLRDFIDYTMGLLREHQFDNLFRTPATEDPETSQYLESRKLDASKFECYAYEGSHTYDQKTYDLPKCLVVPLRKPLTKEVCGVWIRFVHEKRFFIWLANDHQKFWVDTNTFDPEKPTVVAEAIFDALALRELWISQYEDFPYNIAAALGVSLTNDLVGEMGEIILAFDNDRVGLQSMLKLLTADVPSQKISGIILNESEDFDLRGVKDWNELISKNGVPSVKLYPGILAEIKVKSRL